MLVLAWAQPDIRIELSYLFNIKPEKVIWTYLSSLHIFCPLQPNIPGQNESSCWFWVLVFISHVVNSIALPVGPSVHSWALLNWCSRKGCKLRRRHTLCFTWGCRQVTPSSSPSLVAPRSCVSGSLVFLPPPLSGCPLHSMGPPR